MPDDPVAVPDAILSDDVVAGAKHFGDGVVDLLAAAIAPTPINRKTWRASQVVYRPGKRLTVVHSIETRGPHGQAHARTLVTDSRAPQGRATVLSDGSTEIAVWVPADDPYLPGLNEVLHPRLHPQLATSLGFGGCVTATMLSYRPGRRAAVQWSDDNQKVYFKVVEPRRAARIQRLHDELGDSSGVARSLGWSSEGGYVVLEAVPGTTLEAALHRGDAMPSGAALIACLDALPSLDAEVRPLAERLQSHLDVVRALLPERASEAEDLVQALSGPVDAPTVPVHGDFHSGQILVANGQILGLVDVDRAHSGHRVDDVAMMLAQLQVLAAPQGRGSRAWCYCSALLGHFATVVDPAVLRRRTAAAIFGFVPGAFTAQAPNWLSTAEQRLDMVQDWMPRQTRRGQRG